MKTGEKEFFQCECFGHGLLVSEDVYDDNNTQYDFALWEYGQYNCKPSFWWRLKCAWKFLKTGTFHEDQIILDYSNLIKLRDFLSKLITRKINEKT